MKAGFRDSLKSFAEAEVKVFYEDPSKDMQFEATSNEKMQLK